MNSLSEPETDLGRARQRRREFVPRYVPDSLKSGHELVDKIGSIQLQGIVLDRNWFKHPLFQNEEGKPNLTAILVYGDLVDWYRPLKRRDPVQHGRNYAEKKFKGNYLVKIYARWADDIGLTKGQVQDAIYFLHHRNLVAYRTASPEIRKAFTDPEHGNEKPFEIWPIAQMVKEVSACEYVPERLGSHYKTGNAVCDELFPVRLRGDVIDFNWLSHPALRGGLKSKLNVTALFVFANLFFLHTPRPRVDPVTHEPLQAGKWFKHNVLSKDYTSWEKTSGLTKEQLRKAVAFLAEKHLIDRWTGTEKTSEGYESNLRAMIQLRFDDVFDLTFGPFASETERRDAQQGIRKLLPKKAETPRQVALEGSETAPEKSRDPLSNSDGEGTPPEEIGDQLPKKAETSSRKKPTSIGTNPVTPPVTTGIQQQQQNVDDSATSSGGGGFDANASRSSAIGTLLDTSNLVGQRETVASPNGLGTGTEKTDDPYPNSLHVPAGTEKTDNLAPKKRTTSHRKNVPFIVEPSLVTEGSQQQQRDVGHSATEIGGGGFDANASRNSATETPLDESNLAERRETVIARLLAFDTGCASTTIREAAALRLEHAEMWAKHWPNEPESKDEFWERRFAENPTARRSNPGAALAKRLNDPAQIPKEVRVERIKEKRRLEAKERREEERLQREEEQQRLDDETAFQRKMASETLSRFAAQSETVRRAAVVQVARVSEFLVDKSPGKDLRKLIEQAQEGKLSDHGLLFRLTNELHSALDAATRENPTLPAMEQSVPGESDEWDEDVWESDEPAAQPQGSILDQIRAGTGARLLIDELVGLVRDGVVEFEALDQERDKLYELAEWNAIKEQVALALGAPDEQ